MNTSQSPASDTMPATQSRRKAGTVSALRTAGLGGALVVLIAHSRSRAGGTR